MIGVMGWNVYQRVTLIGSLPVAGVTLLQPEPRPPRGPLGDPLPALLGSVMKIQPVFAAGLTGEPWATPLFGSGPFGQAGLLARFMITAWPVTAFATSESVGHVWEVPLGSMK